ncbi:MAG: hypothetical protein QXR53_01890 [Candidatus Norongarragalinales archaeon]
MHSRLLALALFFFTPLAFAQCPYLEVSAVETAQVREGVQAIYPITLTNVGINSQLVSLSANCDSPVECSFAQAPYTTLAPTQQATFQLHAKSFTAGVFQIPLSISAGTNQNCDSRQLLLTVLPAEEQPRDPFEFVFIPTANQSGRPGDEISYSIRVTNNQNAKIYVRFSSEGFFKDATRFSASDIEVEAGQAKTVSIKVLIPPGTPTNRHQMAFNARVTTKDAAEFFFVFPTQIFVYSEKLQLVLQNEPLSCTVAQHGEEAKIRLRVRNDGEIEGPFDIELNAGEQASGVLSVSPSLLEVKQGDSQEILVSIKPKPSTILDVYGYQFTLSYNSIPVFIRDYCFEVFAKTDFVVKAEKSYSVRKGKVGVLLPFEIYNNGSVSQNFAVEVSPPKELLVKPEPSSFSLAAGEKKQVNLVATPSRSMKTGKIKLPVVIRTSKLAKAFSFNLSILAESEMPPDEGDLAVRQESVRAFSGIETKLFITVKNNLDKHLGNARVSFEGIPDAWYSTQPAPLGANALQGIPVFFIIPASEKPDAKDVTVKVETEEGTSVEKEIVLYIEKPTPRIEFEIKQTQMTEEMAGKRILYVNIIVRNTGEKPLSGVKAMLPTGYALAMQPDNLYLQPGQTAEITVRIDDPPSENIPLWLQAEDGTSSEPLNVQAQRKKSEVPWVWVGVALLAILGIIFFAFKRREEQYA